MLLDFINNLKRKYPSSFWLMCFTITWERFSYHGISTLLVLYFTTSVIKGGIGLSPKEATSLYGFYVGILHLTPLVGGWLSDRYLGQQKSIILGGAFISLGNFLLFTSSNIYQLYVAYPLKRIRYDESKDIRKEYLYNGKRQHKKIS